ncbi:hypothetical protein ACFFLM_04430 [Deinococcus oregonensis]|uniref:Uncharacterized protein n=1 Tax=Deinococcus oregonensis TaxID=1805970 RepID=A0ABV6AUQ3_9DEIO
MNRVKVTFIQASYTFDGAAYGPFQASEAVPFLEVPEALANILSLPLYDGAAAEEAAAEGQELLEANASLKAELERVKAELDAETRKGDQAYESYVQSYDQFEVDRKSFKEQLSAARTELEAARAETTERVEKLTQQAQSLDKALAERIPEIDALKARILELEQPQSAGSVIPPDALKRITDVKGVGEKLAPVILAALTAPATEEPAQ